MGYKILVVYNTAGWYFPIVKEMEKLGHTVDFAIHYKYELDFDKRGDFNNLLPIMPFEIVVVDMLIHLAKDYDIIHISSAAGLTYHMRRAFPDKPIVFMSHGENIRIDNTPQLEAAKLANLVLVTTTDLHACLPGIDTVYVPHPVDTELFAPRPLKKGTICMFQPPAEKAVREYLKDIEGVDFVRSYAVPFDQVPSILENYDTYYDIKFGGKLAGTDKLIYDEEGDIMSRMGEEALCMGLKVIDAGFREHVGLPDKYRPENVARQLDSLYTEMMNNVNC